MGNPTCAHSLLLLLQQQFCSPLPPAPKASMWTDLALAFTLAPAASMSARNMTAGVIGIGASVTFVAIAARSLSVIAGRTGPS